VNRRGQVLVLFVILIPLLIAIAAFTIDMGYSFYQSNRLNNINHIVIEYGLKHIDDSNVRAKMIDLLYKNDNQVDAYDLKIENNKITLNIKETVDSIFGKAINIDFYYLSSTYVGYVKNNHVTIEKR
jgi:hypothetical protein